MYNIIKLQLICSKSHITLLIFSLVGPFKNFNPPPFKKKNDKEEVDFHEIWYIEQHI